MGNACETEQDGKGSSDGQIGQIVPQIGPAVGLESRHIWIGVTKTLDLVDDTQKCKFWRIVMIKLLLGLN